MWSLGELFHNHDELTALLRQVHFFKDQPSHILQKFAKALTTVTLKGGDILINQHEPAKALYILVYGRLRAFITHNQHQQVVGEIYAGQVVGEIAMLVDMPYSKTVRALRDCVLLKLAKSDFDKIALEHPESGLQMVKTGIAHHFTKDDTVAQGAHAETITVAPVDRSSIQYRKFAYQLASTLTKLTSVRVIDSTTFEHAAHKQQDSPPPDPTHFTAWFHQQEAIYTYIIYLTDNTPTEWSQWCLRQADRILYIAEAESSTDLGPLELELLNKPSPKVYAELILLHDGDPIRNTQQWLTPRSHIGAHYHIRPHNPKDLQRIARVLTGKSLGVVFSGGGARGASYVGFFKAIHELGIDIDFIGGVSMGAVLAAYIAKEYSWELLLEHFEQSVINYTHFDYILPVFSLLQGKNLTQFVKYMAGDETLIEDLRLPFFCVSTKILAGEPHIHDRGILWEALRASCSLPAIMPPAIDLQGDVLIDGSVLNNLPVDIMKSRIGGSKILAVSCGSTKDVQYFYPFNSPHLSNSDIINYQLGLLERPTNDEEVLNIFNMLELLISLGSNRHKHKMSKEANYFLEFDTHPYGLFEYEAYEKIIDIGYRTSMQVLPSLLNLHLP